MGALSSIRLAILQSGFISLQEKGLVRIPNKNSLMLSEVLNKDYRVPNNTNFFSSEVNDLYKAYLGDVKLLNDFGFREQLIIAAFNAFNTPSIYRWFEIQNQNANLTPLHIKFLEDTLDFLHLKRRSLEPIQWINLIESSKVHTGHKLDLNKYFIQSNRNIGSLLPLSTDEFICWWCQTPNGFQDVLICLNIIFGSRLSVTTAYE